MKKISILLISCLAVASAFLTSCDNDHYGPEPIDVTANYSNKLSNPNPNLILTYFTRRKRSKNYVYPPFWRWARIFFFRK